MRQSGETSDIVFEAFEASPLSKDILASPDALRWSFPDRAVQMPAKDFFSDTFQHTLAVFLDNAFSERLAHLEDKAQKNGKVVGEVRNPGSPAFITQMLLSLVQGIGEAAAVPLIRKRVRDEVSFGDGEMPWRRNPVWLVLRVAMQRQLQLLHGGLLGYSLYKILLCTILSHLLDDCIEYCTSPWYVSMLQKKLGRKMAKLETVCRLEGDEGPENIAIQSLIRGTAFTINASIEKATKHLEAVLLQFKRESLRSIPRLPLRASKEDQYLSLPNSKANLERRLYLAKHQDGWLTKSHTFPRKTFLDTNLNSNPAVKNSHKIYQKMSDIIDKIEEAGLKASKISKQIEVYPGGESATGLCTEIAASISLLIDCMEPKTPSNMIINSKLLLEIFNYWLLLDIICVKEYPLLGEYRPMFSPELFSILQLPDLESMARLRQIQSYVHHRHRSSAKKSTIFKEGPQSFASRFAKSSSLHQNLYESIIAEQVRSRKEKTTEWQRQSQVYDQLSNEFGNLTCQCTFYNGQWNVKGCNKCYKKRVRNRMQIEAQENFLPEDTFDAMAIVFELNVPQSFAAYRDITWKMATQLAYPTSLVRKNPPKSTKKLKDTALNYFGNFNQNASISLCSTSKSFSDTHYRTVRIKCDLSDVLLPLGTKFELFDTTGNIWVHELKANLTLAHYCTIAVPESLASALPQVPSHPPTAPTGPSSYEAVASRQNCPTGMSAHEFEAYQRLNSGTLRRWPTMLVELGSSNIDLGKEYTVAMFSHLAHQAGPMLTESVREDWPRAVTHAEKLGKVHTFFQDNQFLMRLCSEIEKRFIAVEKNWRESNCMEALILLVLRATSLNNDSYSTQRLKLLLQRMRTATLKWTLDLREEVMATKNDMTSKRASFYAFRAALLCRQTFALLALDESGEISATDLAIFIRASIALQQNLSVALESIGETNLRLFKIDAMMCHDIASKVRLAIERHQDSVNEAVLDSIGLAPALADCKQPVTTLDQWLFLNDGSDGWISSTLHRPHPDPSHKDIFQHISLHITQGHLLIDGKTIGKLPDNVRDAADVKAIFGDRHFLAYPSEMPGMSYRIATHVNNHTIYFGFRGEEVIVVSARNSGEVFEYVPRRVFIDENDTYDLPRSLVDNCFHWLDKNLGQLEIRRSKTLWERQVNDWTLNIKMCHAHRPGQVLVDPLSKTAALLHPIFQGFDDIQRMTVFQPIKPQESLNVELRHLELSFFVNKDGALQCRELSSVVDFNQDVGTLYGYQSMIVLHDASDSRRRCLIAPLAELVWKQFGAHISVVAKVERKSLKFATSSEEGRAYARFDIDTTLGRLTCPPEPRLLFTKAQLHAFTSFPLPDPLTGRTGEEEAFHTLLSGRLQPWVSLPNVSFDILSQIEMLAPKRVYYPINLKVLQKVTWSKHLPAGLQSDRYVRILQYLIANSDQLRPFEEENKPKDESFVKFYEHWVGQVDSHLQLRGEIQRMRFECPCDEIERACPVQMYDVEYVSRGQSEDFFGEAKEDANCKASAVFQVVRMLRDKPRSFPMSKDMSEILNKWNRFGGFSGTAQLELQPISSLVDPHILQDQWGNLVETCVFSNAANTHYLMFTLAGFAFAPGSDMDVIRLLAAYCYLPELRSIEMPDRPSYSDFTFNKELAADVLRNIIETEFVDYVARNVQAVGRDAINAAIEEERAAHIAMCKEESSRLVDICLQLWPDRSTPYAPNFASAYLNVRAAMEKITTLWHCLYHNRLLSIYIKKVQTALAGIRTYPKQSLEQLSGFVTDDSSTPVTISCKRKLPTLLEMLTQRSCPLDISFFDDVQLLRQKSDVRRGFKNYVQPKEFAELNGIIASFESSPELLRCTYGRDLAASLKALEIACERDSRNGDLQASPISLHNLQTVILDSEKYLHIALQQIKIGFSALLVHKNGGEQSPSCNWLQAVGLGPRLTTVSILELLQSRNKLRLESDVFYNLLRYGEAITLHQRLLRLFRALIKNDERRIREEVMNTGHLNWKTADYPDWLLLEIDSNMLIREEQVIVAKAMIAPDSGDNAVYQLNMGKGKTSMIVPMVMCVIADGKHLARLGVPKALLLPTAQVLQSRLGGLVGREVRHVAFSRRLLTQKSCRDTFSTFKQHHEHLTENRGILIAAPEHMLAYKLSSEQCYVDGHDMALAVDMMQFNAHLRNNLCRDILDESDYTLAVRTQLVYPSGTFTEIDGAPYRWELLQTLLSLIEGHVISLAKSHSHSINVIKRTGGGFPLVYILHPEVEDVICELIVQDVVQGRVSFLRPSPLKMISKRMPLGGKKVSSTETKRLLELALREATSDAAIEDAAKLFADADAAANGLLLIRGLLKHNILITCLKKRWNVQYGLHPRRWPIAVPYEARGVPSERSEFGHPDVTIIFTCLAFYYTGVNLEQFRQGLGHILHHMDDPATEYEKWSAGDGAAILPEDLQHWNLINIDDEGQVYRLWNFLRYTRSVVNHFLNTFVFPLYCRQFSVKLEASAWDLPIFNQPIGLGAEPTSTITRTTGFSGTNDIKSMLPLTIKQYDLPGLQQTNAEVLTYLLQPRNRSYVCTGGHGSMRWSEQELIKSLARSGVQVFIDAGAYILEKRNKDLARAWLAIADSKVKAAVYFDEIDNRAWVVFRDATPAKAPLVSTPYVDRLEECIVYYDEAHTRGVDLQLPAMARGALTLALGQTKDHTVQGMYSSCVSESRLVPLRA